ncbi:MAG: alpha-L-fucosidase [Bacteroidales bacterium]|nr:alpha-L-fucosidase [Bacteroidales bacterium]
MKRTLSIAVVLVLLLSVSCSGPEGQKTQSKPKEEIKHYEANWESLKQHDTPQWLRDAKFGIYTHWGIYCYSATRGNATWNSNAAYFRPESGAAKDFYEKFGELTPEFGYKDLIPKFTAEKFNAEEWADLFAKSGAKFAGPVAEHHDGFAMWDTKYSDWNAAKMGPKRDIVGELEKAIKAKNMKFVTAFHHAANWTFFPTWDKTKDCSNPDFSGLYGPVHEKGEMPNKEFLDEWYGKLIEVVDKYDPDFMWFDFALDRIREDYVKNYVAYYYNKAVERGKDVVISYKGHDLPPGVALLDHELGQEPELTHYDWITDTSIDDQGAWGYIEGLKYKSVDRLVDNLVDRVSKNGYLLLNIGPKWDGTIPEEAKKGLLGIGKWLDVNGEAIYGTSSWTKYGEGPTSVELNRGNAGFNESDVVYTNEDIRFTVKGNILYATVLAWPEDDVIISSLVPANDAGFHIYPEEIASITMLGDGKELDWELVKGEGLKISPPDTKPCEHAFVFKIVRQYK